MTKAAYSAYLRSSHTSIATQPASATLWSLIFCHCSLATFDRKLNGVAAQRVIPHVMMHLTREEEGEEGKWRRDISFPVRNAQWTCTLLAPCSEHWLRSLWGAHPSYSWWTPSPSLPRTQKNHSLEPRLPSERRGRNSETPHLHKAEVRLRVLHSSPNSCL